MGDRIGMQSELGQGISSTRGPLSCVLARVGSPGFLLLEGYGAHEVLHPVAVAIFTVKT